MKKIVSFRLVLLDKHRIINYGSLAKLKNYVMKHNVMRFAQVAVRVWGCQMNFENPEVTALEGIERFKKFLKSIGMPVNFEELGAKKEDIPKLVEVLCRGDGRQGSISGFVTLTEEDCTKIYEGMI